MGCPSYSGLELAHSIADAFKDSDIVDQQQLLDNLARIELCIQPVICVHCMEEFVVCHNCPVMISSMFDRAAARQHSRNDFAEERMNLIPEHHVFEPEKYFYFVCSGCHNWEWNCERLPSCDGETLSYFSFDS